MAGRIPQTFIDELMSRVDIVEIIDTRVPLRKTGRDHTACCPFHDEKTPSFTVSQQKQFYHCFGCGAHGTALGFLMEFEHLEFVEAVHELATQAGLQVPAGAPTTSAASPADPDLYDLLERSASHFSRELHAHPQAKRALDYLARRGLSPDVIAQFTIGFAPPGWDNLIRSIAAHQPVLQAQLAMVGMLVEKEGGGYYDRFRDRIMFPIRDARGRVIGFGGRVLGDDTPKYLNSPETPLFHKGRELYGLFEARKASRELKRLLVVEGYMDVVALAEHGIHYAVATLGTATTRDHVERLFRVVPELVFCFDGDRAGRDAAWRALENMLPVLHEGRQASFMFLPDGEDPDSLVNKEGGAQFEARLEQASPLSNFFFDNLGKKVDIATVDGRARLVELARPLLSNLPADVLQHMMLTRLAEIARMDKHALATLLDRPGNRSRDKSEKPVRQGQFSRRKPQIQTSQVRLAITLLLQQPALALLATDFVYLDDLDTPGASLLSKLLQAVQTQPHLGSAALLERWRDTDEGVHLMKLAQWRHVLPEESWGSEFSAVMQALHKQVREQQLQGLLDQSRSRELSAAEKLELQKLYLAQSSPHLSG